MYDAGAGRSVGNGVWLMMFGADGAVLLLKTPGILYHKPVQEFNICSQ